MRERLVRVRVRAAPQQFHIAQGSLTSPAIAAAIIRWGPRVLPPHPGGSDQSSSSPPGWLVNSSGQRVNRLDILSGDGGPLQELRKRSV